MRLSINGSLRFLKPIVLAAFGLICLTSAGLLAETTTEKIERWGLFELELQGPEDGNPFVDVQLSAVFQKDDCQMIVDGFYDGEGLYKVRFSPPEIGHWNFVTESNSQILNQQSGSFEAVHPSSRNRGPVRIADTFHFAYADGTPYRPFWNNLLCLEPPIRPVAAADHRVLERQPVQQASHVRFPESLRIQLSRPA